MERVAFLVERTGARISCLLNPEGVVVRRNAGLRRRGDAGGVVSGLGRTDDPLVATGGGVTELDLDLLFDVDIAREGLDLPSGLGATGAAGDPAAQPDGQAGAAAEMPAEMDVRDLTRPIWNLTENGAETAGSGAAARYGAPPLVRLVWGRAWNVLGVVVAVAERLERILPSGVPQRSWLRLRLRRVAESANPAAAASPGAPTTPLFEAPAATSPADGADGGNFVAVPADPDGLPRLRLDQIAAQRFGSAAQWRGIAALNDIDDPLNMQAGTVIRLPASGSA
jgi:hypothetical protein